MLGIDKGGLAALFLSGGDDVQSNGGLTGRFGTVDLDDSAAGNAADAQRHVQGHRAGGNGLHLHGYVLAKAHDRALAELFIQLLQRSFQGFLFIDSHTAPLCLKDS